MVSSGTVTGDLSSLKSYLDSYDSTIASLSSSWKGPSYDNICSKAEEFLSEYLSTIEGEMTAFASACDLYEEYKTTKTNLEIARENYNTAVNNKDSAAISSYNSQISTYSSNLSNLKGQIESALATASASVLATSNARSVNSFSSASPSNVKMADAVESHSKPSSDERADRIHYLVPEATISNGYAYASETDCAKYMKQIEVKVWDGTKYTTQKITVNEKLIDNYQGAFNELAEIKYPIGSGTGAYNYRSNVNNPNRLSDHSLGGAIDLNPQHNPNNGKPDETEYAVTEEVIDIMAKYGFYWGGDFSSTKDPMHFTYAGY